MTIQSLKSIFSLVVLLIFLSLIFVLKMKTADLAQEKMKTAQLAAQIDVQNASIKSWQQQAIALQERLAKNAREAASAVKIADRQSDEIMADKLPNGCINLLQWMATKAREIQK